jgi:nucleoside-diphosphate-sugar epimerase
VDVRDVAQAVEKALLARDIRHETLFISARRTFIPEPSLDLVREYLPATVEVRMPDYFDAKPNGCLHAYTRAADVIGFEPEYDWEECSQR